MSFLYYCASSAYIIFENACSYPLIFLTMSRGIRNLTFCFKMGHFQMHKFPGPGLWWLHQTMLWLFNWYSAFVFRSIKKLYQNMELRDALILIASFDRIFTNALSQCIPSCSRVLMKHITGCQQNNGPLPNLPLLLHFSWDFLNSFNVSR